MGDGRSLRSGLTVAQKGLRVVGRARYARAVRLYPKDVIQYRDAARSEPKLIGEKQ